MADETRSSIQLTGGKGVYPDESASVEGEGGESPGVLHVWEYLGHSAERVWTVPAEEKDWLLLNLLKECWPTVRGENGFYGWLDARGIQHDDFGWASYD